MTVAFVVGLGLDIEKLPLVYINKRIYAEGSFIVQTGICLYCSSVIVLDALGFELDDAVGILFAECSNNRKSGKSEP
ncbi:hypothetical protein PCURB6_39880 [Paenibacillus curdlanolyticus]|nr:hypothetical protein PCURB6_39880 [Paenibacillus curdlanolyticus]